MMRKWVPKTKRGASLQWLWLKWVATPTHDVGSHGIFIAWDDFQRWDDFFAEWIRKEGKVADDIDLA